MLAAADTFSIGVDKEIYIRIAAVCDGYSYYAHFITEKILCCAFDDPKSISQIEWDHYHTGLRVAIERISAELKRPYQEAVNKRSSEYEEVLCATADSEYLQRFMKAMYTSYEYIIGQRRNSSPLNYDKFCARIRKLRDEYYGAILINDPSNPGLYTDREKILRSYVRMQAEAHRVELADERIDQTVKQTMRVPSSVSRGYYASTPPPGIHWERERNNGNSRDEE